MTIIINNRIIVINIMLIMMMMMMMTIIIIIIIEGIADQPLPRWSTSSQRKSRGNRPVAITVRTSSM